MIKRRKFPKIFFGWWTVLTVGFLSLLTVGYQFYGFSALFKPMAATLGFSRTVLSVAASLHRLLSGLTAPLTGWIADKYGPHLLVRFGVVLFALALILMNYATSLWAFYLIWGLMLGIGASTMIGPPLMKAVTNWFVKKRGLAQSITVTIRGSSGVLMTPLITWFVIVQDWRMACVAGGLATLLFGLPLAWFLIKQYRPEYYGLLPDGASGELPSEVSQMTDKGEKYAAEVEEIEFTFREGIATPSYWLLAFGQGFHMIVNSAILLHLIAFLTDVGIDPLQAAGMMAMMTFVSLPVRLIAGFFADRVSKRRIRFLMVGGYLLQALGMLTLRLTTGTQGLFLGLILYGVGTGPTFTLPNLIKARYFGRKAFGSLQGFAMTLTMPASIAAPIYAGWVYDTTGNYLNLFTVLAVSLTIATVFLALALPPKLPAEGVNVRKIQ